MDNELRNLFELENQQRRLDAALATVELETEAAQRKRFYTHAEWENRAHLHPDDLRHSPMDRQYLVTLLTGGIPE